MDWDKKIDDIAWDMENQASGKKTSHKKKKYDKMWDVLYQLSAFISCAILLIMCSQVDKIYSILKSVLDKWLKKYPSLNSSLNDFGITVDIRPIIVILFIIFFVIITLGWIESKIWKHVLGKTLMKNNIYKKLDTVYTSEVQLLIDEMKDSDVSQMNRWRNTSSIEINILLSCVTLFLTTVIVELCAQCEIWKCSLFVIYLIVIEVTLLINIVCAFWKEILRIQKNVFSNQAIIAEYLVEKWRESNKTN